MVTKARAKKPRVTRAKLVTSFLTRTAAGKSTKNVVRKYNKRYTRKPKTNGLQRRTYN